jgi:hypothetical protein
MHYPSSRARRSINVHGPIQINARARRSDPQAIEQLLQFITNLIRSPGISGSERVDNIYQPPRTALPYELIKIFGNDLTLISGFVSQKLPIPLWANRLLIWQFDIYGYMFSTERNTEHWCVQTPLSPPKKAIHFVLIYYGANAHICRNCAADRLIVTGICKRRIVVIVYFDIASRQNGFRAPQGESSIGNRAELSRAVKFVSTRQELDIQSLRQAEKAMIKIVSQPLPINRGIRVIRIRHCILISTITKEHYLRPVHGQIAPLLNRGASDIKYLFEMTTVPLAAEATIDSATFAKYNFADRTILARTVAQAVLVRWKRCNFRSHPKVFVQTFLFADRSGDVANAVQFAA